MAKTTARWINFDAQALAGSSTLTVNLASGGGLEKTDDGIQVVAGGITNEMLAGSIAISKLASQPILADGSVSYTGSQDMGGNKLTNLAQGSNSADAVTLAQMQAQFSGLAFQADVLDTQLDDTLDPGTPNDGDRYILTDTANLHTNFVVASGVEDNDIVEYNSSTSEFEVAYDVSSEGEGAMAWDRDSSHFKFWDGNSWAEFGGLSGITAGDGLAKTSNTLDVVVSDFAGTGLEDSGGNDLQLTAQGDGLTGGGGSLLSVDPDSTTGGDTAPVTVGADGVGVDVTALDGDHLSVDFTPSNYTPDDSPAEAADVDDLAAHLKGIDAALTSSGGSSLVTIYKELTSTIISNGLFTLSFDVEDPSLVYVTPVGGPQQVNKQSVGSTGVTPDFDVLNDNEIHVSNNGSASGLSDVFEAGDVLMVQYAAA